jgi:methyl-accepting chemotaxis protein
MVLLMAGGGYAKWDAVANSASYQEINTKFDAINIALNTMRSSVEDIRHDVDSLDTSFTEMKEDRKDRLKRADAFMDAIRERLANMDRRDDRQDQALDYITRLITDDMPASPAPIPKDNYRRRPQ